MQKSTKKRGRPPINPLIEGTIIRMVRAEQLEPPDKRMPPKVLASEIHKQIKVEIHTNAKLKGERAPEVGTIEKRVQKYSKRDNYDEDKPWSLTSLKEHQIPPEAISTILKLWVWMMDEEGLIMSVREAKWAARFYAAINEGASNVENPLRMLSLYARAYATTEMITEILDTPLDMGTSFDSTLWTLLTGKQPSPELAEKIFRSPQPAIQYRTTEKEWAASKQTNERSPHPIDLELYAIGEKGIAKKVDKTGGQENG